jgi:hypothetical protein
MTIPVAALAPRERNLLFLGRPDLWPSWPFLPVVRRDADGGEELGVVFDALHAINLAGYSATVFRTNLFEIPEDLDTLLKIPKEMFDTPEELYPAGWRVD